MARSMRTSGKGGSLLDSGVAALAALSAGFVTYAMPEALFARLIVASRLPQFLAAAQPPLGMKARMAVIAVVALVVYAFVWTLMRALDNVGGGKRPARIEDAPEEQAPRLRRADAHPDAPSRRPIFAGRDLGEPAFDEEPLELDAAGAIAPEAEWAPEPQPEPEWAAPPEPEWPAQPEAEPEPTAHAPEPATTADPLPPFLVPQEPEAVEEPHTAAFEPHAHDGFGETEESPAAAAHDFGGEDFDQADEEEEEVEEAGGDDQSLSRLMHRFESGLTRKQQALAPPPLAVEPAPVPQPQPEPEPAAAPQERVGHRLRAAISDLGKISAQGR